MSTRNDKRKENMGVSGVKVVFLIYIGVILLVTLCFIITYHAPSVNEMKVLDYIVEEAPTHDALARQFDVQSWPNNEGKLACVVKELIEDNYVEYTEIGGFSVYCVTDQGSARWRELLLIEILGGDCC